MTFVVGSILFFFLIFVPTLCVIFLIEAVDNRPLSATIRNERNFVVRILQAIIDLIPWMWLWIFVWMICKSWSLGRKDREDRHKAKRDAAKIQREAYVKEYSANTRLAAFVLSVIFPPLATGVFLGTCVGIAAGVSWIIRHA